MIPSTKGLSAEAVVREDPEKTEGNLQKRGEKYIKNPLFQSLKCSSIGKLYKRSIEMMKKKTSG